VIKKDLGEKPPPNDKAKRKVPHMQYLPRIAKAPGETQRQTTPTKIFSQGRFAEKDARERKLRETTIIVKSETIDDEQRGEVKDPEEARDQMKQKGG